MLKISVHAMQDANACEVMIGNLRVNTAGSQIEIVALDENRNVKPNSYGCFRAANPVQAQQRVYAARDLFNAMKKTDRRRAADVAFLALGGNYDPR